jgi:hypothetical protein
LWALFTFNAYLPRPANSLPPRPVFAGWLTSELVAHHLRGSRRDALLSARADAWPAGWARITLLWGAVMMVLVARRLADRGRAAAGLGAGYREAAEPARRAARRLSRKAAW